MVASTRLKNEINMKKAKIKYLSLEIEIINKLNNGKKIKLFFYSSDQVCLKNCSRSPYPMSL